MNYKLVQVLLYHRRGSSLAGSGPFIADPAKNPTRKASTSIFGNSSAVSTDNLLDSPMLADHQTPKPEMTAQILPLLSALPWWSVLQRERA
jgi:hypothetical protein